MIRVVVIVRYLWKLIFCMGVIFIRLKIVLSGEIK